MESFNCEIGDWVKGEATNGELVLGYIEAVNHQNGVVKVTVVDSDNSLIIGKTMDLYTKVRKLSDSVLETEGEIRSLIDLALQAKDEKWFMELTERLNTIRKKPNQNFDFKKNHSTSGNKTDIFYAD
ncbi:IDEAL domain-containing protein [Bacillus sp. B15-48]|uniref:IDEAL domain-containing protein n=1 Tax=Bacillus sp. B15-48 TaxID=1548601 RepID=UPI00193EF946|nr:IDEAL domain-containing protein [Bacillus sp. B15-48]MBM4762900.1 IDEAL domain-containing protein [Bacillus sp. B15-48]